MCSHGPVTCTFLPGWQPGGVQWSPRPAETVALAAIGLGLAIAVLLVDPVGRVLVGAAALLVLALAVHDALLRPRLSADPDGVVVRTLSGRRFCRSRQKFICQIHFIASRFPIKQGEINPPHTSVVFRELTCQSHGS